jgi:hypothetical protein
VAIPSEGLDWTETCSNGHDLRKLQRTQLFDYSLHRFMVLLQSNHISKNISVSKRSLVNNYNTFKNSTF